MTKAKIAAVRCRTAWPWAGPGEGEAATRRREPREGLSPGRREQGLVDQAETSSRHQFERFRIQLQAAARLPCSGISEIALNAALAMIEAAAPRDELEGALAVQMACTHAAAMSVLARLGGGHGTERRVIALGSAAARLLRAYSGQVEIFRRLRHGGQQLVRVEHVHVHDGGQAIIGNVKPARPGARPERRSTGTAVASERRSRGRPVLDHRGDRA
jgi:hypothetical protein